MPRTTTRRPTPLGRLLALAGVLLVLTAALAAATGTPLPVWQRPFIVLDTLALIAAYTPRPGRRNPHR